MTIDKGDAESLGLCQVQRIGGKPAPSSPLVARSDRLIGKSVKEAPFGSPSRGGIGLQFNGLSKS